MAYLIGYLLVPVLLGFLITHFAIAKPYEKKHGKKYNGGLKFLFTVLIAVAMLLLSVIA